ncbi:hypothetical protein [Comamonas testosteroni]|uniref:Uncharacterized protein n=1 Tax=Comamonas testosteroni TaxID=285 RepID=A0A096HGC2_COMTE|nr:hypothetical protein [Comamonas testosteroni]KGH27927.1 hypothetical protein P353_16835 [Comamonas testosteroni]
MTVEAMPISAPPTIDTTNLLTILGLVAAAWAVISPNAKLSFRLCMTRFDWLIFTVIVGTIHVLVFEDVLRALGAYPDLGPWRWGLDKNGAIYLLFLTLTAFVFVRSRTFRLSDRKLPLFEQLTTSLLHSRKFAELGELLTQHLDELVATSQVAHYRSKLARWVAPSSESQLEVLALQRANGPGKGSEPIESTAHRWRMRLAQAISNEQGADASKRAILKKLLSSHDLVTYLALAHPYLCLPAMKRLTAIVEDFQDVYFQALLAHTSSVFFTEIRNSRNLREGSRLYLPPESRLLNFYCKDVGIAADLGVYSSVGEAILMRLESDDGLAHNLNKPLLRYQENGRSSCPIYSGIYFFRIMVLEGLYQRVPDHLWLHYVTHVVDRILSKMRPVEADDANHEFATPFSYLLYCVVAVTCDWIEDALRVADEGLAHSPDLKAGHHAYISFQATEALGGVMRSVLSSDKLSERLQVELLQCILFMLRRLTRKAHLAPLARSVAAHLMNPYGLGLNTNHIDTLDRIYARQDYSLRDETQVFASTLAAAKDALARGARFVVHQE